MDTPDTPAQAKAREEYNQASRELAKAAVELREVKATHEAAHMRYMKALGAAMQAGVTGL